MKILIKILLTVYISMHSVIGLCQVGFPPADDTIRVNFLDNAKVPKYKKVKYGHKYVMKIENVNQSLFKVESTINQEDSNTDMPDIFKGIKLPGYLNLALPNIPQDEALKNVAQSPSLTGVDLKELIKKNLIIINNANKKIELTAELNNHMKNLFSSCNKSYKDIEKDLIDSVSTFLGSKEKTRKYQEAEIRKQIKGSIKSAVEANQALDSLVPLHINAVNIVIKYNLNNIILKWEKEPLPKKDSNYKRGLDTYNSAKDENDILNNYKDSLKAIIAKASESVSQMKKFRDENKIHDLITNYNMINASNFTYISDQVKIEKDEVKFDIKITTDKQLPCDIPTKTAISEKYITKGGWKIDFSTGVFFNTGNKDFMGRELQYKPVNDSVVTIQDKDGGKRLLLSVGALMHIYYRTGRNINFAISPGLSTTTAFDGLNLHLGGSFIIGRKNRLVITGGAVFREAKILDKQYDYNTEYLKKKLPDTPSTIKVFPKTGWFISLTYNLSQFKTQSK